MLAMPAENTPDQEDQELMFLLWGGINTKTMGCTNELVQVKLSSDKKRNKRSSSGANKCESLDFVVDLIAYAAGTLRGSSSTEFFQSGTISSPGTGHGLIKIKIGRQCVHVWLMKLSCFDGEDYKLLASGLLLSFY